MDASQVYKVLRPLIDELRSLISGAGGSSFDGYGGAQAHYMCESQNAGLLGAKGLVPPWYSTLTVAPFGPSIAGLRALKPGALTTLHIEHFGNGVPADAGKTILYQLEYGGVVVPGSQITLDAENPLTQSGTVSFPPFPYNSSDVMRLMMLPSALLGAPVTQILGEIG